MNLNSIHNVYFIGIGGIGMSAIARYFVANGKQVAGYDKTQTEITNALEDLGVQIHFEDDIENVPVLFKSRRHTCGLYTCDSKRSFGIKLF